MGTEETKALLEEAHLRYGSDDRPGISRRKYKDSWKYFAADGTEIVDPKVIERISSLAIPPAWENVWISPYKNFHVQATGFDSKGRKQYRYHPLWIELSQQRKFERMFVFAEVLPKIRKTVAETMNKPGLTREKVLATVVWLLEKTLIRIGNEEYEKENKSYGLTTMKNRHVKVSKDEVRFSFKGKSGVYHDVQIRSRKVAKIIKQCQELPGQDLFEYMTEDKKREVITSEDVNAYLQQISGVDITAKDFRTWAGTMLAAKMLDKVGIAEEKSKTKKNITTIVKQVASHLRNLPSTCRTYYIHPAIFDAYTQGYTFSNLSNHEKYTATAAHYKELQPFEDGIIGLLLLFDKITE